MSVFFVADTHFGHANILKYCNRPFENIKQHDETLVDNWNTVVSKNDTVYHLGDFGLAPRDYLLEVLLKLNGNIHFVRGNHDKQFRGPEIRKILKADRDLYEIKIKDDELEQPQTLILCHYPLLTWNKKAYGSICLHGHVHGMLNQFNAEQSAARLDVGVDSHDFFPISFDFIKEHFTKKLLEMKAL